jgi:hypothetical protein
MFLEARGTVCDVCVYSSPNEPWTIWRMYSTNKLPLVPTIGAVPVDEFSMVSPGSDSIANLQLFRKQHHTGGSKGSEPGGLVILLMVGQDGELPDYQNRNYSVRGIGRPTGCGGRQLEKHCAVHNDAANLSSKDRYFSGTLRVPGLHNFEDGAQS